MLQRVLAYHVIFSAYGFWLPNDPRGSWSDFVRAWELFRAAGPATKVNTHRSVAGQPHDMEARLRAKEVLQFPPVVFSGLQGQSIGQGFRSMMEKSNYRIFACAILPDHVHLVLGRHHYKVESMLRLLKAEATTRLKGDGRHPLADYRLENGDTPSPWGRGLWKVYLYDDDEIVRAIRYVEENPLKEGKRLQRWSFVTPFMVSGGSQSRARTRGSASRR